MSDQCPDCPGLRALLHRMTVERDRYRARAQCGLTLGLTYGEWSSLVNHLRNGPQPWGGVIVEAIDDLLAEADTAPRTVTPDRPGAPRRDRSPVTTRRFRKRRR